LQDLLSDGVLLLHVHEFIHSLMAMIKDEALLGYTNTN